MKINNSMMKKVKTSIRKDGFSCCGNKSHKLQVLVHCDSTTGFCATYACCPTCQSKFYVSMTHP